MTATNVIVCPLCNDQVDHLVYRFHLDNEWQVMDRIKTHNPEWATNDGACSRCVDYYQTEIIMEQRMLPEVGPYFRIRSADDFIVLPAGLRLDADARYSGKGITICFIDSDFYLHPDITVYRNRVKKVIDITHTKRNAAYFSQPRSSSWHGTMTSVVCAGDGYLSNGLYKGIASEADLVLLKVQDDKGRITTSNIVKALQWVLDHHQEYNIRIVNMSLGDDEPISYKRSEVDRLAGLLEVAGVVVVAAAGNDEDRQFRPPANAPTVITVGGLDDGNQLNSNEQPYHSPYGITNDGLLKPELIAHAIWIAAPILPGTNEKAEAERLYGLLELPEEKLKDAINGDPVLQSVLSDITKADNSGIRRAVIDCIQSRKYISPAYMHVDGTSFAAPLVSAVVAQLLSVAPHLSPGEVRNLLYKTARRISSVSAARQGYGVVQPRSVMQEITSSSVDGAGMPNPAVNRELQQISFSFNSTHAASVALAGSFNGWNPAELFFQSAEAGQWRLTLPILPPGKYLYKFVVNTHNWVEDFQNPQREPDGYHGFNNIFYIES